MPATPWRLVKDAPDGILVIATDGTVHFANQAACRLLRRSEAELCGHPFGHPLVEDERTEIEVLLDGESSLTAEMRLGKTVWKGHPAYMAVLRDITLHKRLESSLRHQARLLESLVRSSPLAMVVVKPDWTVQLWSPGAEEMFGWTAEQAVGCGVPFLGADKQAEFEYLVERVLAGAHVTDLETRLQTKAGPAVDVSLSAAPLVGADDDAKGVLCLLADIGERKQAQQQLILSDTVFQNTQEGIVVTDGQGRIISVNPAFTAVTGYLPEEVIGRNPRILKSGRHGEDFYRAMWEDIQDWGQWQGEIWNCRKTGEVYPEWMNISAIRNAAGEAAYYVAVFSDISLVKQSEERLHRMAHYDVLTGLPNRVLIMDRLRQALVHARRDGSLVGILFLDLDRFKLINDTLGHKAGDLLLKGVAQRLQAAVREQDTVGRLGGDEFTVILPELNSAAGAANVAGKILEALAVPITVEGHELFVTCSIGIAIYPDSGDTPDVLIKNADIAMYQAKGQGRNNYQYYHRGHEDRSRDVFELEHGLRQAIDRGELRLVYQPEVDVISGRVVAVEALLRWTHPQRGEIPPAQFIPVAEDTGMIDAIGEWVLRQACAQNRAWQDQGLPPVRVAVNLSVRQLRHKRFAERVAEILDETGLAAEWLEVELTESMVMQHAKDALGILWQLKSMGIRLPVDDFGTGYSSLNYLKRLPVDTLKIDRSFVERVDCDANDQAIAKAIIALAASLRLRVVAEGVESEPQFRYLQDQGCDEAQGYFFSRPLESVDLPGLLGRKLH
jgi:diguanylate cyclase (GGDEF)-like protein/PAS domain S-box-containing protein